MRTKQQSSQGRVPSVSIFFALTVIILFSCSQKALAQQWTTNGNDISNANTGNVGIGTTAPGALLDLASTTQISNRLLLSGQEFFASGNTSASGIALRLGVNRAGERQLWIADSAQALNATNAQLRMRFFSGSASLDALTTDGTNVRPLILQSIGGNVGIGTVAPAYKLQVGSTIWSNLGANYKLAVDGDLALGSFVPGSNSGLSMFEGTNGYRFNLFKRAGYTEFYDAEGRLYFNANVGVGTTTPLYKLDVNGEINATGIRINGTPISGGGNSPWLGAGPIHYNGGNVGIGTDTPGARLHVSAGNSSFALFGPNVEWGGSLVVGSGNSFLTPIIGRAQVLSSNGNLHLDAGTNQNVYLSWLNASNTIINGQGGNVGIGTQTPGAKLEVVGNVNVTGTGNITAAGTIEGGNIKAKYQDVAEWVESSQELLTGTLVVLDHTKSNQVIASSQAYDTRVAGVISERPGIALGEAGDNKVLVATTGRVMLTVDASNGPIQIGDLLVTSDILGVAMKSQAINLDGVQIHRPGTLVGKALEPLPKGQGKILVLLSLQ